MATSPRWLLRLVVGLLGFAPFRGVQAAPEGKPFTVVAFGDSTTALRKGFNVYTSQLERRFRSSARSVRFLNRGVPSDTTAMARKRFAADVLRAQPDLVIIQFGINDSSFEVWRTPPATSPKVPLGEYEDNLRYFVSEVLKSGGATVLMTPNQMRWTPKLLKLYGKAPYDPNDKSGMTPPMDPYVEAVRRIARSTGTPLVDVYAVFQQWEISNGKSCAQLLSDGMHPNTMGHTLIADALEPLVTQAIVRKTAGAQGQ